VKAPILFGKYYLLDRVAVGGMAEVYRAKTFGLEGSERVVALKRMLPMVSADKELVSMFIDEAKLAIQLNHPNICQVFDWGKVEDSYYLAMEYVSGCDLRTVFLRCKQQPVDNTPTMPMAQACFVVMKLCEGLDYAHNKKDPLGHELGLVHRDVSPPNIMLSYEGEVKLIDFGVAKVQVERHAQTEAGVLKGKFAYMSPEQVQGGALDRRSDIFSVGIVLYELLTGERLFPVDNELSALEKIRNVEILPPTSYNRRIPEELERIVIKALSRAPGDRYQTAMELHADLQQFMYTSGEFYSRKELAAWLKRIFRSELETEQAQLDAAREFRPTSLPTQQASEPLARVRATMSMAAVRLGGETTGSLRVPRETGAFRPVKEPTGALRVPKEPQGGDTAAQSSWTPGKSRPARPTSIPSTPPPTPRSAVQSIAEAASSMLAQAESAAATGREPAKAAAKGMPKPPEGKPAGRRDEDTPVDKQPSTGQAAEPHFNDDSMSTRPFLPRDLAIIEAAAREGGQPAASRELDEAPTRAFAQQSAADLDRQDPGDLETAVFAPVRDDLRRMAAAAVPAKPGSATPAEEPRPQPAPTASALLERPPLVTPPPMPAVPPAGPSSASPSARSPMPTAPPVSVSTSGDSRPISVLPPPALPMPQTLEVHSTPTSQPTPSGRTGLALALLALLLVGIAGGAYWIFGRSGELIVISDPGHELVVLVDQRPVAVTDSPVRLHLQPGQHTVSVQHSGNTPWSDTLNVTAGETVVRNIRLEQIVHKTGGFTLLSEPSGATVTLDGSPLGQVTPLRVQSVLAGPHTLELRLGDRIWRQQIMVEADKTIDIKATLPAADMPVVTPAPDKPTVTSLEPGRSPGITAPAGPDKPAGPGDKPAIAETSPQPNGPKDQKAPKNQPDQKDQKGAAADKAAGVKGVSQNLAAAAKGPRGLRGKKRPGTGADTPAAPAAAGNNGYLRINSRPWSKIIVDGLDTGLNTPQTAYRISAGKHQVTLYNPQFNIKETMVVTVQPGETQTITKIFQQH